VKSTPWAVFVRHERRNHRIALALRNVVFQYDPHDLFSLVWLMQRPSSRDPRALNPVAALWLVEARFTDYVIKEAAVLFDCSD
jgi:hypothetical protein